jgi:hypothetical protein
VPEQQALTERVPLAEAAGGQTPKGRRFRARIIQGDIQGSSGYYPASMLKRDAGVFREGLPVFLDHPGATEAYDRPERSVRDLAGRLATTAVYEGDGLYADVEVYPHWAPVVEAMAGDIGMSIRAAGTVEASTDDTIRGPIVTSLSEAASVDFVTAAGAGGKIVALLESARSEGELLRQAAEALAPPFKKKDATDDGKKPDTATDGSDDKGEDDEDDKLPAFLKSKQKAKVAEARNVGHWLESRMHKSFTEMADDMFGDGRLTRDERIALSSAVGDGLQAFSARVEADCPHLYQRDIWDDPETAPAEVVETAAHTTPAPPAPTLEESRMSGTNQQGAPDGAATDVAESARERELAAQLTESTKAIEAATKALTEAQQAASAEIADLKKRLDESDDDKRALANDKAARTAVAEALKTSSLHAVTHARVTESVCRDLPTTEDGALDAVKLGEVIKAAIEGEQTYVASLAEATGAGVPRGLGGDTKHDLSESDLDKELAGVFTNIGMTEKAALTAAHGRG